jgi:preprotein translocase subunit YajC
MKSTIACLLILTLVIPAEARERTPQEQAKKIAIGSKVVAEMKKGGGFEGRLGTVTETQFTLEPLTSGKGSRREILFQDVSKIRSVETGKKEILLKPLEGLFELLALIPIIVICGVESVFHKDACSDL